VVLEFHALLREALAIKRWLASRRRAEVSELLAQFRRYYARSPMRLHPMSVVDEAFLIRYWRPVEGRLVGVVWRELATRHDLEERELKRLVFGIR
jgi:hypothetical protein